MSCSVHDAVRLEARGIPTAVVGTEPFLDEALDQSRLLGMPNYPLVLVAHPVQLLTVEARLLGEEGAHHRRGEVDVDAAGDLGRKRAEVEGVVRFGRRIEIGRAHV